MVGSTGVNGTDDSDELMRKLRALWSCQRKSLAMFWMSADIPFDTFDTFRCGISWYFWEYQLVVRLYILYWWCPLWYHKTSICDICTNQHLHLDLRHVTGVNLKKKANKLVLPIKLHKWWTWPWLITNCWRWGYFAPRDKGSQGE